jgi:glycosyltransferase involved in cell wall biosynthesis
MPKVLFLMPTFLHERFLKKSIQCVLDQTFKDFAMIIMNDCSPDKSQDIIESFSDPRIIKVNTGVELGTAGKQINECFRIAKDCGIDAPYECRVDGDNYVRPNFLERMIAKMDGADFLYSRYKYNILDDKDNVVRSLDNLAYPSITWERLLGGMCVGPSVMWTKDIREMVGGFTESWHEDWSFPLSVMRSGGKLKYLNEILMDYNFHKTNVQHRMAKDQERFCEETRAKFR